MFKRLGNVQKEAHNSAYQLVGAVSEISALKMSGGYLDYLKRRQMDLVSSSGVTDPSSFLSKRFAS